METVKPDLPEISASDEQLPSGADNAANKRRRTAASNNISNFEDGPLAIMADYLELPSRAMLGVALTAPSSYLGWRSGENNARDCLSQANRTVLYGSAQDEQWSVLDFRSEKSLAKQLTDDDLHAILVCIDAGENLKRLRLGNCTNLMGSALEILRGSTSIEQIHLQNCSSLELGVVLPILQSIVRAEGGSALKHLAIPQIWHRDNWGPELIGFLAEYNDLLERRQGRCHNCNELCGMPWIRPDQTGGYQKYTCCECLKICCNIGVMGRCNLFCCESCKNFICHDCVDCVGECESCLRCTHCIDVTHDCSNCAIACCDDCRVRCGVCNMDGCGLCVGKESIQCRHCNRSGCLNCIDYWRCDSGCGREHCSNCYDVNNIECNIRKCPACGVDQCLECFTEGYLFPLLDCEECDEYGREVAGVALTIMRSQEYVSQEYV